MSYPAQPPALSEVVDAFISELDQLESIFATCAGHRSVHGYKHPYVPTEDGCLVSLWDAWNRFLRALVILSASGPVMGLRGIVYSPGQARTEAEVLAHLARSKRSYSYKITRGEPNWYIAAAFADIVNCLQLDAKQIPEITGPIAASIVHLGPVSVANPLEEIRTCRNFVAHKNDLTHREMVAFSQGAFVDLSRHLRKKRSGVEAFSEWKDCMTALAEASAQ